MKKLFAVTLAILMLAGIVGCNKDGGEVSSAPTTDAVEAGTVAFTATETVFEEGTKVTAETVTAGAVYERAKTAVAPVAEKFTVFEFNAVKDEAKVQPNGKLAVTFRIPDDYSNNVKILYVADDGTTEEITATVNAGERTIVAELTHFSTYVLIDLGADATTTTTGSESTTTSKESTTSLPSSTATIIKPTTTTTTAKPTTTTTTTVASYSAFKSFDWQFRTIVEDGGKFCRTYTLKMTDGDFRCGEASAMPFKEWAPPEAWDIEEPDFEFGGIEWKGGSGGATPLSFIDEKDNTITFKDEEGKTLVLTRTSETTAKVVSNTTTIDVKAGDVFSALK